MGLGPSGAGSSLLISARISLCLKESGGDGPGGVARTAKPGPALHLCPRPSPFPSALTGTSQTRRNLSMGIAFMVPSAGEVLFTAPLRWWRPGFAHAFPLGRHSRRRPLVGEVDVATMAWAVAAPNRPVEFSGYVQAGSENIGKNRSFASPPPSCGPYASWRTPHLHLRGSAMRAPTGPRAAGGEHYVHVLNFAPDAPIASARVLARQSKDELTQLCR